MAAPFIYRPSSAGGDGDGGQALFKAATDGNLGRLKGIVKSLTKDKGDKSAIFSFNTGGLSVLHVAASFGHLEVCKYLVEELKGDVNAPGYGPAALGLSLSVLPFFEIGMNAFMASAQSGDVPTVKYFLDHGGDLMKVDDKGRTVLHHAVCAGCCKVTEFLLSKGVPVDVDSGRGTPLFFAATNEQDKTLKILLDHHANAGANVDGKGCAMTPLVFATSRGGYTKFIHFLLKAGADPNIPDDLFLLFGELFGNEFRSLCKLLMGNGEGALSDALRCRMLRPKWGKACYRQAAAHMLLKEYKQACDALLDAQKLDPGNVEIENELRKAKELMKNPSGDGEH
ncbi:hypothetical protein ACQ4PT_058388 [Festuca glaucescens]